ncbi:MAG TPA: DUF3592 domain-containing protein [Thermoanaerobaculia bacterium]|nr:DUF3592 domain-containing protein [Thermoanaerobaculia bacterium]
MSVVGTIALVAGGLLVLWSLWIFIATKRFRARCVTTQGTVVAYTTEPDSDDGADWYYAVIGYTDAAGVAHKIGGGHGLRQPPEIGESCSVTYDPEMPENAFLTASGCMWLIPVIVLVAGLAAIGAGIVLG